jgi:dTDP-4-amino-4,6-dideoxygalactose transaminase
MGQRFGYKEGDLPITEDLSSRSLRLPFYNDITVDDQIRVVNSIASFLMGGAG